MPSEASVDKEYILEQLSSKPDIQERIINDEGSTYDIIFDEIKSGNLNEEDIDLSNTSIDSIQVYNIEKSKKIRQDSIKTAADDLVSLDGINIETCPGSMDLLTAQGKTEDKLSVEALLNDTNSSIYNEVSRSSVGLETFSTTNELAEALSESVDNATGTSGTEKSFDTKGISSRSNKLTSKNKAPIISPRKATSFSDTIKYLTDVIGKYGTTKRKDVIIMPKPETVARLMVMNADYDDSIIPLYHLGEVSEYITSEFVLQSVNTQEAEKYQVIETFGENYINFFGSRPKIYQFSGTLLNSLSHQWKNKFIEAYESHLKGTKCAENNSRVYLIYEEVILEGYILNLSISMGSQNTNIANFNFSMFITNASSVNYEPPATNENVNPQKDPINIVNG